MSDDQVQENNKIQEANIVRGVRGVVGIATPSKIIKRMYHEAHFQLVNAEDKRNPNKKKWVPNDGLPSLKQFTRSLVLKGDTNSKDFLENKSGAKNQPRTDANIALTKLVAAATHLERRKKSAGNGKK